MITSVSRRALLGLPVVALAGCGGGAAVTTVPEAGDVPSPALSASPSPAAAPGATASPSGPGTAASPSRPGAWADGQPTFSISLVRGYGVDAAIDLLTGGGAPRFDTLRQATDWAAAVEQPARSWGFAAREAGWTMLWEEIGFFGWREEVARRLSRRGVVASAHQDEENGTMFLLARGGRIVRSIDTDHPWNAVGPPLPQEAGLGIEQGFVKPSTMLVLLSRVTGTPVVEPSWRDRPGVRVFGEVS